MLKNMSLFDHLNGVAPAAAKEKCQITSDEEYTRMSYVREVYKVKALEPYKPPFIGLLSPLRGEEKRKS